MPLWRRQWVAHCSLQRVNGVLIYGLRPVMSLAMHVAQCDRENSREDDTRTDQKTRLGGLRHVAQRDYEAAKRFMFLNRTVRLTIGRRVTDQFCQPAP
jgi:hypothetical protein